MLNKYKKEEKHFIPFIMAGDPSESITIDLALQLQKKGASVLELGVPYSDPLADGPVIQRASLRARKNGMNIVKAIELGKKLKENGLKIPIILFTYFNPVLKLGTNRFFALMQQNDIDGLLIPDLPFEESEEVRRNCEVNGIDFISMVAPTSEKRIEMIAQNATGFLYCVSSLGVTGERSQFNHEIQSFLQKVKTITSIPVVVGFGVSNRKQVESFYRMSDGVVVGSAIIRKIEELLPLLQDEDTKQKGLLQFELFLDDLLNIKGRRGVSHESERTVNEVEPLPTGKAD
ncbi:tryptophan synthase subunit alpha [Bacillus kexueae]|uniref:tryptophan synthase subunit alpha n=1 Tax=Aeribacillus kexueae TaxID=2078952 RepID=UPI001FAED513|nr:tryptophan synthase subunit alpha [Bacillus kexueae]